MTKWTVTVALVAAMSLATACGDSGRDVTNASSGMDASHIGPSTVVRIDASSGAVRKVIRVGPDPLELRVAAGQIWTQNFGDGSMTRIDPATERAVTVPAGKVAGLTTDGDDLWVAEDGNHLSKIDGKTGVEEGTIQIGSTPLFEVGNAGFPAVGGGSIWLTVPKAGSPGAAQSLWRIEPESGRVLAKIAIGRDPVPPFVEDGRVWVITADALLRLDMASDQTIPIAVASGPFGLAAGAGSLWVGHESPTEVWRLDPATGKVSAKVDVGEAVRGLAFGGDRLWVTTGTGLLSIDPATNKTGRKFTLTQASADEGPIGVAYLDGSVWVSVE